MSTINTRPVICQGCRKKFVREEGNFIKVSSGYFHKECYEQKMANKSDMDGLYSYLAQLLGGDNKINYPLIQKQVKELTARNRMTVQGITGTLVYLNEVKRMTLNPRAGIIIVAYHYEDAKKYFEQKSKIGNYDKNLFVQEAREVYVRPQQTNRLKHLVDLGSLFEKENDNGTLL